MDKYPPPEFTFVGDPGGLPDAFYDAMAGLLLSLGDESKATTDNHAEMRESENRVNE